MKAARTLKNLKCHIHHKKKKKKKKLLKRKGNSTPSAKTDSPISQFSSECLKLTIQTYQMKTKNLIMKLGQLQEEITKASLPVIADLSHDFTSIILETDQRKISPS